MAINRYDIHEARDQEPRPPKVEKIIAGTEHRECRKRKPRSGHQNSTIDMARMIAADDERGSRKLILPCNCQTTITDEKHSAKGLKHGITRYRRQKHILRFAPVRHRMSSVLSFALVRCVVRLPECEKTARAPEGPTTLAVGSFFDPEPHTLSRLEAATRPYQSPESFIVRFWLRKSV